MHIFIDESGGFQRNECADHSISCVCAIVVPGRNLRALESGFNKISRAWPRSKSGEVKGHLLSEQHLAHLCEFLRPLHVILEVAVMDMNLCEDADVDHHRAQQARGMTVNLTDEHHPELVSSVWKLRRSLEQMPRQLYAQAVALTDVAWTAFEHGQLYLCQRYPGELARYRWVIDAKEKYKITEYEHWWQHSVMPLIQSRSLREPSVKLKGGDYSAYRRNFPASPTPDYLVGPSSRPNETTDDLRAIFRELEFAESEKYIGLQVVDVLANGLRRSLSGRMGRMGWSKISDLTIHQAKGAIILKNIGPRSGSVVTNYADVVNEINAGGRSKLVSKKMKKRFRANSI